MKYYIKNNTGKYESIDIKSLGSDQETEIMENAPFLLQESKSTDDSKFDKEVSEKINNFHQDFITKVDNDVEFLKDKAIILDSNITIHELDEESEK